MLLVLMTYHSQARLFAPPCFVCNTADVDGTSQPEQGFLQCQGLCVALLVSMAYHSQVRLLAPACFVCGTDCC